MGIPSLLYVTQPTVADQACRIRPVPRISIIASRHVRHRYRIFQNFGPVAVVAKPVDEREKLGGGSEQVQTEI